MDTAEKLLILFGVIGPAIIVATLVSTELNEVVPSGLLRGKQFYVRFWCWLHNREVPHAPKKEGPGKAQKRPKRG